MNLLALAYLIVFSFIPNAFYKGRTFSSPTWWYAVRLTLLFIIGIAAIGSPAFSLGTIKYQYSLFFLIVSVLWFLWPWMIRKIGIYPDLYIKIQPSRFLVRFDSKIGLFKYTEVILQEVGFLFLIFVVLRGNSMAGILFWAAIVIGVFHVMNYLVMPKKWATFYFILSLPMAIIFSLLIMKGYFFITLSLHLLFYLVHNSLYWKPHQRLRKRGVQ